MDPAPHPLMNAKNLGGKGVGAQFGAPNGMKATIFRGLARHRTNFLSFLGGVGLNLEPQTA